MATKLIKNILIIGGGFLGLKTAKILSKNLRGYAHITLITSTKHFTFYPHLFASLGKSNHDDVYIPLYHILDDEVEIIYDTITNFSFSEKTVASETKTYSGDYIIFAGGGVPFPLPENACDMNGSHTQIGIQSQFLDFADSISRLLVSTNKQHINFHIIGGGITGIEFAGRIEYLFRNNKTITANIEILERGPKILGRLNPKIGEFVLKFFTKHGVSIIENRPIDEIKPLFDHSHTKEDTFILWTSGVQNNPLLSIFPTQFIDPTSKKALVNEYFEITPGIYAGGDMAQSDQTGLAQGALSDSFIISNHIIGSLKNIPPEDNTLSMKLPKAFIIPISKYVGIFEINNAMFFGFFPVILRFLADINFFISFIRPKYLLFHVLKLF